MSIIALDMPSERDERISWLEKQLIGLELGGLTSQLEAVNGPGDSSQTLDTILGDKQTGVLAGGFSELNDKQIAQLLTHPRLLLELQECVCERGGAYWSRIELTAGMRQAVDRVRRRLDVQAVVPERTVIARIGPWLGWVVAAAIAIVVAVNWQSSRNDPSWGWLRPDALASSASTDRGAYLNRLAGSANEWFQVRPTDRTAAAARISELRRGCTRLLLSEHPGLPPADKDWLLERCQVWAGKLDQQLAFLESGMEASQVIAQVDETVNALIKALRLRATTNVS